MIEQEIIKQYPSLVARPYLLIKDDFQRKDMQRFWFENTISFLAVLSAAELVKFYKSLKSKEEKSEKDLEMIHTLQENKSLTMVGLEHMALGKWVMMLRETTKALQELNAASTIPELVEFYHGKNGKKNAKLIDKFVSIRNDDAHGNPIPEEKLKTELDSRQKLIDSLLEELSFLKNYQLILPETLEIEGSHQFYICKQFIGNGIVNTKQTFEFSPQLSEVMLINQSKKDGRLSLNPLLLYLGIQDEENNFLGIFSKYSSKDGTEAKYLNLDGSGTIDLVNFGQDQEIDLIAKRQSYNEIYSDPESFQVNLNVEMKFEEDSINIREKSVFSLLVENKKSADIEEARFIMDIPRNISIDIEDMSKYQDLCTIDISDEQIIIEFQSIEDNQKIDPIEFSYTISEQGSYSLDGGRVLYSYYRTLADRESSQSTDEEAQFGGAVIEAQDPNSRDKMIPVINIKKGFIDEDGNPIQNVRIGEDFIFTIIVTNIGFSSAKNVMIDLVFPDNVNLKQGKETIKLGQLNPFESRTFKYVLNSHVPDIYTIVMQNVLYSDSHNTRYSTRCADDHFIIVRSDLVKEFVYNVKDYIDDLYIDDEEKANIHKIIEKLDASIDVNAYDVYKEAETEAVINIVRDLTEKTADKQELKIVEKIYEEGKRDSKITNVNPRKFLVFSSKDMPFFAINLSKGYEPEFFALRTNIDKRFDNVTVKQAVVKGGSYTLDHSIDFSKIKYSEKYGKAFFSQWLNIVLKKFSKEYITWKALTGNIGQVYGEPITYISGYFSKHYWDDKSRESGVNSHYVLIDRENPQSFYVVFSANPTANFKKIIHETMEGKKDFTFLNGSKSKDKTRIYGSEQLAYYMQKSDSNRITKFPAITMSIRDEKSMDLMMEKTQELWEVLCLSHSLDLFEEKLFSGQNYIKQFKEFTQKLFNKGFALRQNEKNEKILEVYPMKDFAPHTSEEKDCIAFLEPSHKSWKISLKFYEDVDPDLTEKLAEYLKLYIWSLNGWIRDQRVEDDVELSLILDAILRSAEVYSPSKEAIWPEFLKRDMILDYGQKDVGFFLLLKGIMEGKNLYSDILEEFTARGLEKELDRTIKYLYELEEQYNYVNPINIIESDDKELELKEEFKETVQKLYDENPKFTYLEEGPALFRIYSTQIVKNCKPLPQKAPYNDGHLDKAINKIKSKYFNKCLLTINPKKGQEIDFSITFFGCKGESDEVIKSTYSNLAKRFDNKLEIGKIGNKNQNYRVSYTYKFTDFEDELENIRKICDEFFTEALEGVEILSEDV